jgi:hypothetical protein
LLTTEETRSAGLTRLPILLEPLILLLGKSLRYALEVEIALRRRHTWMAIELLHRSRTLLMEVFARTHGGQRTPHTVEAHASPTLQARLGTTLPQFSLSSAHAALLNLLDVLAHDLDELSAGQLLLTDAQRDLLERVRQRQGAALDAPNVPALDAPAALAIEYLDTCCFPTARVGGGNVPGEGWRPDD